MDLIRSEQIRGGRAMLGWSQTELAEAAGVSLPTIKRMEKPDGTRGARAESLHLVHKALENAGIEFIFGDNKKIGIYLNNKPQ